MNAGRIKALTAWLINRTHRLDKQTLWGEIEVILSNDANIAAVKEQVFNRKEITDVIALRYNPVPGIEKHTSAELFINVQRAAQRKNTTGWNPSKELALYLAHGCDHLAGADDSTKAEYNRMRNRELRWLREADKLNLTDNLITCPPPPPYPYKK